MYCDGGILGTFKSLNVYFSSQIAVISFSPCVRVLLWHGHRMRPYFGRAVSHVSHVGLLLLSLHLALPLRAVPSQPHIHVSEVRAFGIVGSCVATSHGRGEPERGLGSGPWGCSGTASCQFRSADFYVHSQCCFCPTRNSPFRRVTSRAAEGELGTDSWSDRSARGCQLTGQFGMFTVRQFVASWKSSGPGVPASQPTDVQGPRGGVRLLMSWTGI